VHRICPPGQWEAAVKAGVYLGSAADARDGFINLSTGAQVAGTLEKHFARQKDLVVGAFDEADVGERLRCEPSQGGELLLHLYGQADVSLAREVELIDPPLLVASDRVAHLRSTAGKLTCDIEGSADRVDAREGSLSDSMTCAANSRRT